MHDMESMPSLSFGAIAGNPVGEDESHMNQYASRPTKHFFDLARLRLHRLFRTVALRTIDCGVAGMVAAVLTGLDQRRGLYLRGRIAAVRRRNEDHTDFWIGAATQFPSDAEILRGQIHAALRSGRVADAEEGFRRLMQAGAARAADSGFAVGLAYIDQRHGGSAGVRARLRQFFASLRWQPKERRIAALKLCGLIFAHFPRTNPQSIRRERDTNRMRFLGMLARSAVRAKPRQLLERVTICEENLAAVAPASLFDTDASPVQCRSFIAMVRARLSAGEPFSFVRLGDGDAACLPYEPDLADLAKADAVDRERIWWGRPLRAKDRVRLAQQVSRAMWDADCIGLPTLQRFIRELRLTKDDSLENRLTGRGLRAILHAAERYDAFRSRGLPAPVFTSSHLHQDLERWGLYGELFEGVREIVLLSCHPGLAEWVEGRFGVSIAASILVPPDHVSGAVLRERIGDRRRLPEMMDEVLERMGDLPRNRLVLIGAGYPGKWLVNVARARGGVALDLGSIFDYWLGLTTRSYLDLPPV